MMQSIEMHIMVHSQLCLGVTAVTYRWETWKVLFIQQIKTQIYAKVGEDKKNCY